MKNSMKWCRVSLVNWKKRRYVFALIIIILSVVMFGNAVCNIVFASSETIKVQRKRFVSVKIEKGDTLWSIAEDYYSESGKNKVSEYIKEIKLCNRLKGNTIHTGRYLVIPYFENITGNE